MDFVTARELRLRPRQVWERLEKEKALIITSNGKPIGMLSDLPEGNMEQTFLFLRRLRAQQAVAHIRRQARAKGLDKISPADIDKEIRAVRHRRAA